MTVAHMPQTASSGSHHRPLIAPHQWLRIALLASLFVGLFYETLFKHWGLKLAPAFPFLTPFGFAWRDQNWSHGLIVPLISLYFIYQNRQRLIERLGPGSLSGAIILLAGIGIYFLSFALRALGNDMVRGYAMILSLFGLLTLTAGWRAMSVLWFPVAYLAFAVKVSERWWDVFSTIMQKFAAHGGTLMLNVVGKLLDIDADLTGTQIHVYHRGTEVQSIQNGVSYPSPLNIAEACSGMRSLMAFIALGVAVAYLVKRPWWSRLILVASTVPIALFINVSRLTILGLIHPFNQDLSHGDFHGMMGLLMLIPALALFLLVGWVLDQLLIDDPHAAPNDPAQRGPQ